MKALMKAFKSKKIILFGTGGVSSKLTELLPVQHAYYVDNDTSKWNTSFMGVSVFPPSNLLQENKDNIFVLVASSYYKEIREQLKSYGLIEKNHFENGTKLFRLTEQGEDLSMSSTLGRVKSKVNSIVTIIDVGASNGSWTDISMEHFPDSKYFLIEANQVHEPDLVKMKKENLNVDYVIAAAGQHDGEIYFSISHNDKFGGAATTHEEKGNTVVPVKMLDTCVKENNLSGPFLIKLDTHGFEIPIFEGAKETLKHTEMLVVEAYNFEINDGYKFYDLCKYLEKHGFRCIDLASPMHRPMDKAFWQLDLFFIKSSNPLFLSNSYN